jgi:hypothetical protein
LPLYQRLISYLQELHLQEFHLLAESTFLKTLAELQLLILLEACWALGRDYQGLEVFFTRS